MTKFISGMIGRVATESENRRNGNFHHAAKTKPRPARKVPIHDASEPLILEFSDGEDDSDEDEDEDEDEVDVEAGDGRRL